MTEADLDDVLSLDVEVHSRNWTRATFVDELGSDGRVYLVARDGPVLAGYGGLAVLAEEAHITTVAVRPSHRRRGIGARLVRALLTEGCALGATTATLEVRASNTVARELYRRIGFAPVGARPGYYEDTGEDALIMWLHDLPQVLDSSTALPRAARTGEERSGGARSLIPGPPARPLHRVDEFEDPSVEPDDDHRGDGRP